jgi:hypothetical protein
MMLPANRQDLANWLVGLKARKAPVVSKYLQDAVKEAFGSAQFVVACDMTNLLARPQVRARLRDSASLAGKKVNLDELAEIMTGLKGVTLRVTAGEKLEGKMQVDFGATTDPLKPYARDLILEVLEEHGAGLPELRDWRTQVYGTAVHFEGRLSTDSLRTLSNFIAIPERTIPSGKDVGSTEPSPARTAAAVPAAADLAASRRYFHEVQGLVDDLRAKHKSTQNYNLKLWADRYALQIDRLSVLNIDPEVVEFGTYVSQTLRSLRNIKVVTRANEKYARASTFNNSFYADNMSTATVIHRQADAMMTVNVTEVWTALEVKSAELRKKMSLKYQVEF